jgi:hypothetical protein
LGTIHGSVWKHTDGGVEPVTSGNVFAWIETPTLSHTTGRIPIDADGRYAFTVPQTTTRVHVQRGMGSYQPCAVTVVPTGDVAVDLHVVSDVGLLNANLPAALRSQEPTLSGVVFEVTANGPRRLANVWVTLDSLGGMGNLIADTVTDPDGRYVFCAVPHLPGVTVVAGLTGFDVYYSTGNLAGRTTLDIEMRRGVP